MKLGEDLETIIRQLEAVEEAKTKLTTEYNGPDDFEVGDIVTYHGSMPEYHGYVYRIEKLFDYNGIPSAQLQGSRMDWWIERCRVSSIAHYEQGG